MKLALQRLRPEAVEPRYATEGAAGLDLAAAAPQTISPGHWVKVPTGWAMAVPVGFEAQIRPRSGLAARHGVTVLNSPGTIDSDYRGEVCVLLVNLGPELFEIEVGDRIAQLVLAPVTRATLAETDELDQTTRGSGGFGSTGIQQP